MRGHLRTEVSAIPRYLVRRLAQAVLVVFGITVVVFVVMRLTGDPAALILPLDATAAQVAAARHALGVDRPLYVQFAKFVVGVAHGDFGASLASGQPAMQEVLQRFPKTAYLALWAMVFAVVWALPAGVLSATREGSLWDVGALSLSLVGQSMPVFWIGLMLIAIFGVALRWLPVGGSQSFSSVILPAVSLAILFGSTLMRQVRSGMVEVMRADFVRTARSKGLPERVVLYRHALRNTMLPVITVVGLQVGTLLGGAVITEQVFAWPGLGRLIIGAIGERDFPVVQAGVFVIAVLFVATVALTDIAYVLLDPRVKLK